MSLWFKLGRIVAILLRYQMWATLAKLAYDKVKQKKQQEYKVRFDG